MLKVNVFSKKELDHWDIVKIRYLLNNSSEPIHSLKEVFGRRFNKQEGNNLYFDNVKDKGIKTEVILNG